MPTLGANRVHSIGGERLVALLAAIRASGTDRWQASKVAEWLGTQPKNLGARLRFAVQSGQLVRTHEGRNWWYVIGDGQPVVDEPADVGDFEPILYGDGTLVLSACPVDDNGVPTLSAGHAALLKRLLNGAVV